MERTKRRQQNDIVQDYYGNKKRKLQHQNDTSNKSLLENLPNEILYEIFEYLDIYHVYDGFFNLKKRFKSLLINSTLPIQINISTMTKTNFQRYYKKIILPNRHRINMLRLSNPFTIDIVFSPSRFITQFFQLETLVLDNINSKSFNNISGYFIFLPKLHSLTIDFAEYIECPSNPFRRILSLSKLKYCKITYQTKDEDEDEIWPIFFVKYERSPIEYLVINTRFPFESFDNLLSCLPRLRHLSINCLVNSGYMEADMEKEVRPIVLKRLKSISLKLDWVSFNQLEDFIKNYFNRVEVLRLTTRYDSDYLNAKQWEQLISSYMPNLHVYDVNHRDYGRDNRLKFHDLINQYNSSFWIDKQWFFTHQYDWHEGLYSGIFHSTDLYRRKDYKFHWEFDRQICSHLKVNYNSVQHVNIHSKQATENCIKYFPNATELTIKHYFITANHSIPKTLDRIVSLGKLTKLAIESSDFPFGEIVKLIRFTPNLHTLKFNLPSLYQINSKFIQQSQTFEHVSNTNKIKYLDLGVDCTLKSIQLIVSLFPKLEYFKIEMKKEEINEIVRFLLSKTTTQTQHLFFLCISEIPKRFLKELNMLIKLENLLDDYFIKFVDRDLYLWW